MQTLGEFYKEKILIRADLISIELPERDGENEIVKDLFGWKLYSGKNSMECNSEEEARYLKVFLDAGMDEVFIPTNKDFLNKIVEDLENLKTKIDKIINLHLSAVFNRSIKERVKHEVYQEIIK